LHQLLPETSASTQQKRPGVVSFSISAPLLEKLSDDEGSSGEKDGEEQQHCRFCPKASPGGRAVWTGDRRRRTSSLYPFRRKTRFEWPCGSTDRRLSRLRP